MNKISVVIRNKDQEKALEFLLSNLETRYKDDIDEIIVIDNLSVDNSVTIAKKFGVKVMTIQNFSYGGSANLAAESAQNNIVVIFSAHAYPVSHDFFKQIVSRFDKNKNLAGLRCIHNSSDFKKYISGITAQEDSNGAGLIFCGSAFNRKVWKEHPFNENMATFEDKEWTSRVLLKGFDIEFSPSIFCYEKKRTNSEKFFRFRSDVIGSFQLWDKKPSIYSVFKGLIFSILITTKNFLIECIYSIKRFLFMLNFLANQTGKYSK